MLSIRSSGGLARLNNAKSRYLDAYLYRRLSPQYAKKLAMGNRFYESRLSKRQRHACSACQWFIKIKHRGGDDAWALCERFDLRMRIDRKCLCSFYKRLLVSMRYVKGEKGI